jgi:cytidylate kinase
VLTLASERGAGDSRLVPALASRLRLRAYDHELIQLQAACLRVPEEELDRVDEQAVGQWLRFLPNNIYQRSFDALKKLLPDLAARSDVLLVGRGGSRTLRDHATAFHVRLTAPFATRLSRVMEDDDKMGEEEACLLIARTNDNRRAFYQDHFGADWYDPLEYDVTVNTGRGGSHSASWAVNLIALAAERHWQARVACPQAGPRGLPDALPIAAGQGCRPPSHGRRGNCEESYRLKVAR